MMKFKVLTSILCLVMAATLLPNLVFAQNEASEETVQLIPEACGIGLMSYMTYVRKSMYKGTYLQVILNCPDTDEEIKITKVEWRLLSARCFNKLGNTVIDSKTTAEQELQEACLMLEQDSPANTLGYSQYNKRFSFKNDQKTILKCSKGQRNITIPFDEAKWVPITTTIPPTEATTAESPTTVATPTGPANKTQSRRRRDGHDGPAGSPPQNSGPGAPGSPGAPKSPAPASPGSAGAPSPPQGPPQSGPKAPEPNPPNAPGKNTSPGGNLPGGNPAAGEPDLDKPQEKTLVGNPPADKPVGNSKAPEPNPINAPGKNTSPGGNLPGGNPAAGEPDLDKPQEKTLVGNPPADKPVGNSKAPEPNPINAPGKNTSPGGNLPGGNPAAGEPGLDKPQEKTLVGNPPADKPVGNSKAPEPNPPNAPGKNTSPGGNLPGGNPAAGEPGLDKPQEKTLVGNPPADKPVGNSKAPEPYPPNVPGKNTSPGGNLPGGNPAAGEPGLDKPQEKTLVGNPPADKPVGNSKAPEPYPPNAPGKNTSPGGNLPGGNPAAGEPGLDKPQEKTLVGNPPADKPVGNFKAPEPYPPNAPGKNTSPGGNLPGGNPAAGEPGLDKPQEKTLVGNPPADKPVGNSPVNNTEAKGPPVVPGSPTVSLVVGTPSSSPAPSTVTTSKPGNEEIPRGAVLRTESDGVYIFVLVVTVESNSVFNYTATITPIARHGHLSAIDFPLLRFYAVMFVVYAIYLIVWLTLCCCYRRDILQVQYWITAVIFLGLLEKTIFLGENDTLNRTGHSSVYGALVFGELMSCAKKTLSRMLVVVVSVGFGIVKPRLGPTLQKVLVVGLVYFIACSVEGGLRVSNDKADITKDTHIPFIVLSIVEAMICCWIFTSLVQTMRTLRLRRNLVKLSLYRHFTNTLIFAVIASVAFMLWSIRQHKMTECLTDWKSLWFDEAFWHILSSTFLLIIMILWRPSENNKIYDCTNDQDEGYHDSENQGMNFAFDGMKLRSKDDKNETNKENVEANDEKDDLKLQLLEGKMALSLTDSALPSMSDLVEEIVATENEEAKLL